MVVGALTVMWIAGSGPEKIPDPATYKI